MLPSLCRILVWGEVEALQYIGYNQMLSCTFEAVVHISLPYLDIIHYSFCHIDYKGTLDVYRPIDVFNTLAQSCQIPRFQTELAAPPMNLQVV